MTGGAPQTDERFGRIVEAGGLIAWAAALAVAALSPTPLVYDEPFYLAPVAAFQHYGISYDLLFFYPQVGGIVHTGIQWAAAPFTHLSVPGVRVVSACVMALALAATVALLRQCAAGTTGFALRMMALPPVAVVTGMALTEAPAILLTAASLALFYSSQKRPVSTALWLGFGAGLLFSGAVLAKQIALPVVGGGVWLGWARKEWRPQALMFVAALVVLLPAFISWGALAPPLAAALSRGVYSMRHAIFTCGYAGAFAFILARGFYAGQLRKAWPYIVAACVVNAFSGTVGLTPMASVLRLMLGEQVMGWYAHAAGAIVVAAATLFVWTLLARFREHRDDAIWASAAISLFLGIWATGAVTHSYSGRYLAVLAPVMLVVLLPYRRFDAVSSVLLLGGYAAGTISLLSYLQHLTPAAR